MGSEVFDSLDPSLPAAGLHGAAVAAGCRGSCACSGGFGPIPLAARADSSGRGSTRGGMWLLGRLVYCAGNKGTVVPGLLKCLGVQPLPSAGGWSTLGSRPGGGTLLRNVSSSIAFCLGLSWASPYPGLLSAEGCAMAHCPPPPPPAPHLAGQWQGSLALTPKGAPSQVPGSADSTPLQCGAG